MADQGGKQGPSGPQSGKHDRIDGYANALFEVASVEGSLDAVENELFQLARALESSDELRSTLTDAGIPVERRQSIIEDLLSNRASPVTVALVSFVVGSGRARDLPAIVDRLVERAAQAKSKVVAEVRTAVPLTDDQRTRLAAALGTATGKSVEVKAVVDRSVLGGVVAQIGDTVIDGSVRARLEQLREAIG
ncbi:MAG: F-type H+-transporting ATPase subunit delta [Actinomycetota bacterium]|jgi:F-type H+-transporting ATPase subunit delta|nr:F-type H+-transporting ATPase subunit delta [Actinomycetota bacterium]